MLSKFADAASDQIQKGVNQAAGGAPSATPGADLGTKIMDIVNIASAVAGVVAVAVLVYAGFRLVVSRGNAEDVKSARSTIIYAIVGLIIIALAQAIVHFVINGVNTS